MINDQTKKGLDLAPFELDNILLLVYYSLITLYIPPIREHTTSLIQIILK